MPRASYKTVGELVKQVEDAGTNGYDDQVDENTALLREEHRNRRQSVISEITDLLGSKSGGKHLKKEEQKNAISGVWGAMHGKTVSQQILSPCTTFVLSALVTIATTIGVLGVLPYSWAAYSNICLFVLYRPFYYTAVSDYSAKVFGFRTFGTVYGLIICLAGLFNFSQSGLDALLHKVFNGNPVPVNLILLGSAFLVGIALCTFVGIKAYTLKRDLLIDEAEDAREVVMPGAMSPERL
ncbi:putative protein FMP42 [Glarea lozoyensis 74030]|uniref:Uncharacterized protein n=1 Tax=Glarea lozoyensis (strain ATCC 74030 / MF5533) TaxID=1104152 RepID=H0EHI4_GLAL7|nr:putative protein FMP42 [Glarea lozoyensis 74030]